MALRRYMEEITRAPEDRPAAPRLGSRQSLTLLLLGINASVLAFFLLEATPAGLRSTVATVLPAITGAAVAVYLEPIQIFLRRLAERRAALPGSVIVLTCIVVGTTIPKYVPLFITVHVKSYADLLVDGVEIPGGDSIRVIRLTGLKPHKVVVREQAGESEYQDSTVIGLRDLWKIIVAPRLPLILGGGHPGWLELSPLFMLTVDLPFADTDVAIFPAEPSSRGNSNRKLQELGAQLVRGSGGTERLRLKKAFAPGGASDVVWLPRGSYDVVALSRAGDSCRVATGVLVSDDTAMVPLNSYSDSCPTDYAYLLKRTARR